LKSGSGRNDTETEAINQAIVDSAQQTTKSPRPSYICPIDLSYGRLREAILLTQKTTVIVNDRAAASSETQRREGSLRTTSPHRVACDRVTDVKTD